MTKEEARAGALARLQRVSTKHRAQLQDIEDLEQDSTLTKVYMMSLVDAPTRTNLCMYVWNLRTCPSAPPALLPDALAPPLKAN